MFKWDSFEESIGKLKTDYTKKQFEMFKGYKHKNIVIDKVHSAETVTLKNEFDEVEIRDLVDASKNVLFTAHLPGAGKSHACNQYAKGLNMLIVSNDHAIESKAKLEGYEFMTLNGLFGLSLKDVKERQGAVHKLQEFDIICFEEIAKANMVKIAHIKMFVEEFVGKKIILANGDNCQIINEIDDARHYNNVADFAEYKMKSLKKIFGLNIHLNVCKRMQDPEDQIKLKAIHEDLFINNKTIKEVAEKYIDRKVDGINQCNMSWQFIVYSNACAWNIRNRKHNHYVRGNIVTCRSYMARKDIVINCKYEVVEFETVDCIAKKGMPGGVKEMVHVKNVINNEISVISLHALYRYFEPDGIITAHSAQGATIAGDLAICEYDAPFCQDKRWFWAGITRATTLKKLVLVKNMDSWTRTDINAMIDRKISNHVAQDEANGSMIVPRLYVDRPYMFDIIKKNKMRCSMPCCYKALDINECEFDRIDNKWGLVKGNVQILCLSCNRRKGALEKKTVLK
jgi:hypothetical protein